MANLFNPSFHDVGAWDGLEVSWSFPRFWSQLPHCSKLAHVPSSQSLQGPSPSQVLYIKYIKIYCIMCVIICKCVCVCLCDPICVYTFTTFMCFFRKYTLLTPVALLPQVSLWVQLFARKNSGRQQSLRITTWMVESCTGVGFVGALTHRFFRRSLKRWRFVEGYGQTLVPMFCIIVVSKYEHT